MSEILARKDLFTMVFALVQQFNALHDALAANGTISDGYGTNHFHRDISAEGPLGTYEFPTSSALSVSAPVATDLPTLLVLLNFQKAVLAGAASTAHFSDDRAHLKVDAVNFAALSVIPSATDLASALVLVNGLQTLYNAHRTQSGVHPSNDTVNTWTGSAAVDLATAIASANFGTSEINDHILSGPSVGGVRISKM